MFPKLFSIGPVTLHSYGLMVAIGVLAAARYLTKNARRLGKSEDEMVDLILVTVISGFVAARLLYVIYEFDYFEKNLLDVFAIWKGGLVFYGGLIGGVIGFLGFARIKKWPILKTLDLFTPATVLAQGFGRIGCFLNGCCYGKETHSFIGVTFPFSGVPLHPTQLYEAFFSFMLFGFLVWAYRRRNVTVGMTSFLYFTLQPLGRFLIDFLRNDTARFVLGLTSAQWTSAGLFVAALIVAGVLRGQSKHAR